VRTLIRWNTAAQLAAVMILIVVISSAAIGWQTYRYLSSELVNKEMEDLSQSAQADAMRFSDGLNGLRRDVRFLSEVPSIEGFFRSARNGGIDP
jgi:hypothetical protein